MVPRLLQEAAGQQSEWDALVRWTILLLGVYRSRLTRERFRPFGPAFPIGTAVSAQKAQLRHDYFSHLSRLAFSIVVFPCLQPALDEQLFAFCDVLSRNLTEPVPTDAMKPLDVILVFTIATLKRLIDGEREIGHRLASSGKFQLAWLTLLLSLISPRFREESYRRSLSVHLASSL